MNYIRLRHVAEVNPSTPEFDRSSDDEPVTFLPLEAVWPGARLDVSRTRPKKEVSNGYTRFREEDILVPKITPTFEADRSTIAHGLRQSIGAGTTELHIVRPGSNLNVRYANYLLSSRPFLLGGKAAMKGVAGQQRVPDEWLLDLRVPVAGLTQQRAIADYLDAETARIDALIEKKRRMIELLEKRWRSAVEHRMVELATHYGTVSLRRLVQCLDGQRIPLSGEQRADRQDIYPYYGASGVIDQVDDYLFDEELVLLGEDGAQLADPDYEISFVVREKCWVNNHAHILRPLTADADFLALHLSTFDRFAFISGSTREKITQEDMWKITVPAIDLEAQCDEAQRLIRLKLKARDLGDKLSRQIELLTEHRQALITAAVTGQLKVPGAARGREPDGGADTSKGRR